MKKVANDLSKWPTGSPINLYLHTILYKPGKDNLGADALRRLIKKQKIESDIFYLYHGPKPEIHSARNALVNENYFNLLIGEDSDTAESEIDSTINNKLIINKIFKKRTGNKSSKETTRAGNKSKTVN
jgi:hypothetical protein